MTPYCDAVVGDVSEIQRVPTPDEDDDDDSSNYVVENHISPVRFLDQPTRTALTATAAVDISINSELSRASSPTEAGQ